MQGVKSVTYKRKPRVGFTIKRDVTLLRSALNHNPWQLGDKKWKNICEEVSEKLSVSLTVRTIKGRINLLLEKFNFQLLETTTETEEEITERGSLLAEISAIIEEERAMINRKLNASNDAIETNTQDSDLPDFEEDEVFEPVRRSKVANSNRKTEREQADFEREALLNDAAPGPLIRKKRSKLSLEDEMIQKRQAHEMFMEKEKLKLEQERLELDKQREKRLQEEGERSSQLTVSQMQIQTQMLEMMKMFANK